MTYLWKKKSVLKKRSVTGKLRSKDKQRVPGQLLPTEHEEQVIVVCYAKAKNLLFYAVPNGGMRKMLEGVRLKAEGVQAGVPDLCFPMPMPKSDPNLGHWHGLYIEMKRTKGGCLHDNQKYWITELRRQGYRAEVVRGHKDAIDLINDYFGFLPEVD